MVSFIFHNKLCRFPILNNVALTGIATCKLYLFNIHFQVLNLICGLFIKMIMISYDPERNILKFDVYC